MKTHPLLLISAPIMTVTLHFYSSRKIRENNFKIRQWPFSDKKRTRNNEGEKMRNKQTESQFSFGSAAASHASKHRFEAVVLNFMIFMILQQNLLKNLMQSWALFCLLFGIFWVAVVLKRFSELFLKVPTDFSVPMIFSLPSVNRCKKIICQ